MRHIRLQITATLGLFCAAVAHAQQPPPTATVPKLVRFSGSFRAANGLPTQFVESVTLSVYRDQTGGTALWQEVQNVAVDANGNYSLLMGATQNEGMPLDLFSSGEPRWLGAQFNRPGEVEQPRVLLVSVPYALKASDAETLGGRPASAYLLAGAPVAVGTALDHGAVASTSTTTPVNATKAVGPVSSGFPNFIAKFVNTTDVGDSPIYDSNGSIGISTTQPLISLDVRTGSLPQMGIAGNTDYLTFFASDIYGPAIYWDPAKDMRFGRGGTGLYNPYGFVEQMRIQSSTGNVGIGTQSPGAKLEVNGSVQADGNVTIAALGSGLIFPDGTKQTTAGGGGITGVTAGIDLTGGGTTGTVTLNLDTTKVPTLAGANSFTGSPNAFTGNVGIGTQSPKAKLEVNGNVQADGNVMIATVGSGLIFPDGTKQTTAGGGITGVTAGTDLTGGGTSGMVTLNLDTTKVPTLAGANSFTGSTNAFTGNVGIGTQTPGSTLDVAGDINFSGAVRFQGSPVLQFPGGLTLGNIALGIGGLESNTSGFRNTGIGTGPLSSNTTGAFNTATGDGALYYNTSGFDNTASGAEALITNVVGNDNTANGTFALNHSTGNYNTASGSYALEQNTTGNNNIAIGYQAAFIVSGSNSNNIHIGHQGSFSDSGTIRIGTPGTQFSLFAAGVRGVTTGNNDAIPVMVDSAGQLGTVSSSRRFKEDIEDMGRASHDLMRLRPVTFRYKQPFADGSKPIQYGLIAEEVAEVYPDLVAHSADGQIETVKYQVLDSMLLNEVQRQQDQIRRLEQQNHSLQERLARLETALASTSRESRAPSAH